MTEAQLFAHRSPRIVSKAPTRPLGRETRQRHVHEAVKHLLNT